jgi:hypothetical protein
VKPHAHRVPVKLYMVEVRIISRMGDYVLAVIVPGIDVHCVQ